MQKLSRKHIIQIAVMSVIFVLAAALVYNTTILNRAVHPRVYTQVKQDKGKELKISSGDHLEQKFHYKSDWLLSVGTAISLDQELREDLTANQKNYDLGVLHIRVLGPDGTELMTADYDVCFLDDGQNLLASFPEGLQKGWSDTDLTMILDAEDIEPSLNLAIGYTNKQVADTSLTVNGEKTDMTLNIKTADHQFTYWIKLFYPGAVLVYLMLLGTYLGFAVFRAKSERVFLFTGSLLAIIYLVLLPPMSVPDEPQHYVQAYHYLNVLTGVEKNDSKTVQIDLEDYHAMETYQTTPSLTEYDILKKELLRSGREGGTTQIDYTDTQAPKITYVPGMLGIALGRLIGLNGLLVILLGRFFSILCYLITMYWFIRLMPFAKAAAFILAILPITVQQCCSYSYDSIVIETVFLYLAILFGLLYKDKAINKWTVAGYAVFVVMLSICKGGTYMPLCLLTMLIPPERFRDKKQKWIFVGSMAALAVASFLVSTLSYALYVASPTAEQAAGTYLGKEAYGAAGLLADPMNFILKLMRTLFLSGDGFIETMLGMQLGWLNVFVSRIVIYGMLAMILIANIPLRDNKNQLQFTVSRLEKVSCVIVFTLSALMVFASMFMSWTPRNSLTIQGVQGRYFLPAFPVFLLVCRSKDITASKDRSRILMFLAVCLQCVAIYGILLSLEDVL